MAAASVDALTAAYRAKKEKEAAALQPRPAATPELTPGQALSQKLAAGPAGMMQRGMGSPNDLSTMLAEAKRRRAMFAPQDASPWAVR